MPDVNDAPQLLLRSQSETPAVGFSFNLHVRVLLWEVIETGEAIQRGCTLGLYLALFSSCLPLPLLPVYHDVKTPHWALPMFALIPPKPRAK